MEGKQWTLTVLLAWLLLLNEALLLNGQSDVRENEGQTLQTEERQEEQQESKQWEANQEVSQEGNSEMEGCQDREIRVLLMDTGYQSYYHPSVSVIQNGESKVYTCDSPDLSSGKVVLDGGEDGITVRSISRQAGNPVYQGRLEIIKKDEGLLLVNVLPLETYLEAVVPSEMPPSYEEEALMAQAVCARTYACKQMEEGRLQEYEADVDDSVSFQVYWNLAPDERTTRAIEKTKGKVITQNGQLIEAYYFSTSAGVTSTDEIWGAKEAASYLQSVECTFDSDLPWSSWSVEIPWNTLCEKAASLSGCGGNLTGLEITKKSQSGAVTGLHILTEDGSGQVLGEYAVREFFSPKGCIITENNGADTEGGTLLPSAYFTMEIVDGEKVVLEGSGYGHGVGMSQNGANEMAKEGYGWEEILGYFFKDVEYENS